VRRLVIGILLLTVYRR